MIRGVRGATTVEENNSHQILTNTQELIEAMTETNNLRPSEIASVLISVTSDIDDAFPAKALRKIDGWKYVPVMCMNEINVPGSLERCIRVMITANTEKEQEEITHIYHHEAKRLRPDLLRGRET